MSKFNLNIKDSRSIQDLARINELSDKLPLDSTPVSGFEVRTENEQDELDSLLNSYSDYLIDASEINNSIKFSILNRYITVTGTGTYRSNLWNDISVVVGDVVRVIFTNGNTSNVYFSIGGEYYTVYNMEDEAFSSGDIEDGTVASFVLIQPTSGNPRFRQISGVRTGDIVTSFSNVDLSGNSRPLVTQRANNFRGIGWSSSVVQDNKIFVLGGRSDIYDSDIEDYHMEYNPATNTWRHRASSDLGDGQIGLCMFRNRGSNGNRYTTIGGEFYVFPSSELTDNRYEYDLTTNTWSGLGGSYPSDGIAYSGYAGHSTGNFVMGGRSESGGRTSLTERNYREVFGVWTQKVGLSTAKRGLRCVLIGDIIYAMGGSDDPVSWESVRENEAYNVITNTWTSRLDLPTYIDTEGMACTADDSSVYIQPGRSHHIYEYNPALNTYSYLTSLGDTDDNRAQGISETVNGVLYFSGGQSGNDSTESILTTYAVHPHRTIISYVNSGARVNLNIDTYVGNQNIPANTLTTVTTSGYLMSNTNQNITGTITYPEPE